MRIRKAPIVALGLMLLFATVVVADCPFCDYSPNHWGFCKADGWYGSHRCSQFVADPFTGRTYCDTCGYCGPDYRQTCEGDSEGPFYRASANPAPCGIGLGTETQRRLLASGNSLSWVGASIDKIAIF